MADEHRPLLASDHRRLGRDPESPTYLVVCRHQTKRFLTSKYGHYAVLLLVSLDITAIFADLIVQFFTCEGRIPAKDGVSASNALGIVSLVFSCLFMAELLASIWAFGLRFFNSWFHCLDAVVIAVGFIVDVVLKGVLEEIGSLVVVLRLWRVMKIIEELSAGAEEQMEPLHERIEDLESENITLRREIVQLKSAQALNNV